MVERSSPIVRTSSTCCRLLLKAAVSAERGPYSRLRCDPSRARAFLGRSPD
jgi:hypothetical protein